MSRLAGERPELASSERMLKRAALMKLELRAMQPS